MKTSDLVNALAADSGTPPPIWNRRAIWLMRGGLIISVMIFSVFIGVRPDISTAIFDPHVIFKFIFSGSMIFLAARFASSLLRPGQSYSSNLWWVVLPLLTLAFGALGQMITSPVDYWLSGLVGRYPEACLMNIPILASAPLICLMIISRNGAPTNPALAGLWIGAQSGALGASLYALHCPDDSALFVATWYSLAIMITSVIGMIIGARVLKW